MFTLRFIPVLQVILIVLGAVENPAAFGGSCGVLDPELIGRYEGGCKNGLADGRGIAIGTSFYQGQFRSGKKHGQGVKVWSNGDRYEGGFKDDAMNGVGSYRWGAKSKWAGDFYVGEYRDDMRHGQGVYEWASGDRYEGIWKDDLRYGLSAMEIQKQRARAAWMDSVGRSGNAVCSELPHGLASSEKVCGKIERVTGDQVEVRLTQVGEQPLVYAGKVLRIGQTITGVFSDWHFLE